MTSQQVIWDLSAETKDLFASNHEPLNKWLVTSQKVTNDLSASD